MEEKSKIRNVLVEHQDPKTSEVNSTSGIQFHEKYVLIPGNFILRTLKHVNFDNSSSHLQPDVLFGDIFKTHDSKFHVISLNPDKTYKFEEAIVAATFLSGPVLNSTESVLKDWTLDSDDNERTKNALPLFCVLSLDKRRGSQFELIKRALGDLLKDCKANGETIFLGREVVIKSAPFANRNFINSYSKGVLSNVLGDNGCLLLSDCPTVPGSEGSPIFVRNGENLLLVGIVLSSLSWWKGEWIGLTLGVSICSVLRRLNVLSDKFSLADNSNNNGLSSNSLGYVDKSVVQVVSGNNWGSGIILDKQKGVIITNAHVVNKNYTTSVRWNGRSMNASVVYRTPDFKVYDLAILKCNMRDIKDLREIGISPKPVELGVDVFSVGFSLFSPAANVRPTLSKGVISQINDCMLRTTCSVHPGASGGAVVLPDGRLVGIIVCNARLDESGTAYPRINMAIPISNVYSSIQNYLATEDPRALAGLHTADPKVNRLWLFLENKL